MYGKPRSTEPRSEENASTNAKRKGPHEPRQLIVSDEARAARTDLQGADRREPSSPSPSTSLGFRTGGSGARACALHRTEGWAATATGTEAVGDLGDRNHGRVTVLHWLGINVANAEVALEDPGDGLERRRG
jgi:hypothetical protein